MNEITTSILNTIKNFEGKYIKIIKIIYQLPDNRSVINIMLYNSLNKNIELSIPTTKEIVFYKIIKVYFDEDENTINFELENFGILPIHILDDFTIRE